MNLHKQRLLNVVRALKEAPNPKRFTMEQIGTFCRTPACALGHYAARHDLQHTFSLSFFTGALLIYGERGGVACEGVLKHFGITTVEALDLFDQSGCDDAQTLEEAIEYIEQFARRKWPEPDPAVQKLKGQLQLEESI